MWNIGNNLRFVAVLAALAYASALWSTLPYSYSKPAIDVTLRPLTASSRLFMSAADQSSPLESLETIKRESAIQALSSVIDPDSGKDVVESGLIRDIRVNGNNVELDLIITKANVPIADELKKLCLLNLSMLDDVSDVVVNFVTENTQSDVDQQMEAASGLKNVRNILAVSSCKGGVGKSTVSVNLAYTLQKSGARVGILDADIYGPSLPTMTSPIAPSKLYVDNRLIPLEYEGVKLMSLGFINKGAAIMRGPMVNQILNQFVTMGDWGELDYLIIDMPPGTGDIQLTLAQIMNITAAVIVTTPQRLSFVDVVKGIDMFDTVNVPSIAVVENMAEISTFNFETHFYDNLGADLVSAVAAATNGGKNRTATNELATEIIRQAVESRKSALRLFGPGHIQRLKDMWGIENLVSLPLLTAVSKSGDSGMPYVLAHRDSTFSAAFDTLATGVVQEVTRLNEKSSSFPPLYFNEEEACLEFGTSKLSAFDLRCDCRCAVCVEELTGRKLLDKGAVSNLVKPTGMSPIGKYAVSVDWSDGHKSLYPYKQIAQLANQ